MGMACLWKIRTLKQADHGCLLRLGTFKEEFEVPTSVFWKVHHPDVAEDSNDDGEEALPNEYPSTTALPTNTVHLLLPIRDETTKRAED
jgi:hypothetical protein